MVLITIFPEIIVTTVNYHNMHVLHTIAALRRHSRIKV